MMESVRKISSRLRNPAAHGKMNPCISKISPQEKLKNREEENKKIKEVTGTREEKERQIEVLVFSARWGILLPLVNLSCAPQAAEGMSVRRRERKTEELGNENMGKREYRRIMGTIQESMGKYWREEEK